MFVYPKQDMLIRDPEKRDLIPASGREVAEGDTYWARRLTDGDVTTAAPSTRPSPRASGKGAQASTDTATGSNNA